MAGHSLDPWRKATEPTPAAAPAKRLDLKALNTDSDLTLRYNVCARRARCFVAVQK